jgi:methylated-DNA-protein-cysteine methyltransferase-like protein
MTVAYIFSMTLYPGDRDRVIAYRDCAKTAVVVQEPGSMIYKRALVHPAVSAEETIEAFSKQVISVISRIPKGNVAYYSQIAALAGSPGSARQVARLLHSSSKKYNLPWHRVVNARGKISLPVGRGYERQRALLEAEGVVFGLHDRIDFETYLWVPDI